MLKHLNSTAQNPSRVVVLGAKGFVGEASVAVLRSHAIEVLPLGRRDLDLLAPGAADHLGDLLKADDSLLVVSAKAPVKDQAMLLDNIAMMKAVCDAIEQREVAHVVYISSDAVYADSPDPLDEGSCAEPGSLHGAMHLTRELMLRHSCSAPLAVLRPTLIYGLEDPHNGYGPNRFRRLAAQGEDIVLFGEGEERRDHVWIEDVAELVTRSLRYRSRGVLNLATGTVVSFREVAECVVGYFPKSVAVLGSPRQGPMPHNGYRPFDPAATRIAFPDFSYTQIVDGMGKVHRQLLETDE